MNTRLLGLGTATPRFRMSQDEALRMFTDIVCENERHQRLARALFRKSQVRNRHTVVPHQVAYNWCQGPSCQDPAVSPDLFHPSDPLPRVRGGQNPGPTTRERMRLYARFASDLAVTAAERALAEAQVVPGRITHLITVTCTGFDAPGVDLDLIDRLQLPSTTQRINVGFMGCHGAINGLRVARALAADRSDTCVLLSAVELCSLHYRFSWDGEGVIGNALFADGSAALVLASQVAHLPGTRWSGWEVVDTGSVVIAESRDAMSWRVGDHGFEMRLTSDVGDQIEHGLRDWLHDWLAMHGVSPSEIDFWGVHPGGPRILEAVQRSLQLEAEAVETSRRVLAEHGNMSSPTVLFILQDFLRQQASGASSTAARGSHCLLLAFGPGLVAETALLKRG